MKYIFTDISTHLDFGFGVTAGKFRDAAEFLNQAEDYNSKMQSDELPTFYLYRHSIELYLKSLIIILHNKLQLPYKNGEVTFDTNTPYVYNQKKNQWNELTKIHDIDTLYSYFMSLIAEHKPLLNQKAPEGGWNIEKSENEKYVNLIRNYDFDSTYFRYPVTKNSNMDHKKYGVERVDEQTFMKKLQENKPEKEFTFLVFDENENFIEAHRKIPSRLQGVAKALKELSYYLEGIHAMTRHTLCDGW
ncbi:hypothetical protein [Neobacillus mesonae]|uniref:hypothetical protein n=1 Tax=Neobacillus mesonae TaxID=1193713 RepID=UPI00203C07ED|nr:hypothetical protein [Neobacillus mesonae]MCM3569850.1 hypothetical protein [Neobacillus mesonae]